MSPRWSAVALAVTIAALLGVPAGGQSPAPPCPAGVQIAPNRLEFSAADGNGDATQSLAATHRGQLFIYLPADSSLSLTDPAIHITGPPGLPVTTPNKGGDPTSLYASFVPTTPGTATFTATWSQLAQENGSTCTASASPSLNITAPTPVRALKTLGYSIGHRAKKPGTTNEFSITALVKSNPTTGDESPIRLAVRAVTAARRPSARAPVTSVTLDPANIPAHGVRASTSLLRLTAGQYADEPAVYQFKVGVFVHPRGRRRARRGVEMVLSQGSRTLATYRYVTSCDSAGHGSLECIPLPRGVRPG
jgi:hypothetical protein